jgi:hypothetical protein
MKDVVAKLDEEDMLAIAAYLATQAPLSGTAVNFANDRSQGFLRQQWVELRPSTFKLLAFRLDGL